MSFQILGLGTAVPRHSIEQTAATELAKQFSTHTDEQKRLLPVLYRRTGVKNRHSVLLETADESVACESGRLRQNQHSRQTENGTPVSLLAPPDSGGKKNVTQTFYPPAETPEDGGPTTSERMEQYAAHAAELAIRAATEALEQADQMPEHITHLVTVSCTGFQAPGVDLHLIRELGLPAGVARSHIGFMGCHGALNGLRVARAFAESDPKACVLMVAVELCSLHQQYGWQPDRIVANALFADGAAAIVGRQSTRNNRLSEETTTFPSTFHVVANGSLVLSDTEDVMSWRIGDHGFEMTLSPSVPNMIRESLGPWLSEWLLSKGCRLEEVESWAIHPGGPRILSACGEALNLSVDQLKPSRDVLSQFGNMSSPTVLFILERLSQQNASRPCVALAFGPGLAIEAMLLR